MVQLKNPISDTYEIMDKITIIDVNDVINRIAYISGICNISMEKIKNFILSNKYSIIGLNDKLEYRFDNFDRNCTILWLHSGYYSKEKDAYGNKKPIFISVVRQDDSYSGYFVNTPGGLVNVMRKKHPEFITEIEENFKSFLNIYLKKIKIMDEGSLQKNNITISEYATLSISSSIHDSLLIHNWNSVKGLDRYIKLIGCRLVDLVEQKKEEYYILNEKQDAIINSGLFDKFGNDIKILYTFNHSTGLYDADALIQSKISYIQNGFTKEQASVKITPIRMYDKDDVFDAEYQDFDVNYESFEHIIEERRDRFPQVLKETGASIIADKIDKSLKIAIEMNKRDDSYIKPYYTANRQKVSWAIPLHIETEIGEKPELVLICRQTNEYFYEIKTILPYDESVQDKMLATRLYSNLW